ncbi:hypothetical protein RRF57_008024 [Xylaria bambusicola]|uniref:Uncharacterized protein n=1 Tax=Xylaria bambusicola TaxID=326684 RepID=A0AAN7UH33_9PEZI
MPMRSPALICIDRASQNNRQVLAISHFGVSEDDFTTFRPILINFTISKVPWSFLFDLDAKVV